MARLTRRDLLGALAGTALGAGSTVSSPSRSQAAARLVDPYDAASLRARKGRKPAHAPCPLMTPPSRDLVVPEFYVDPPIYSHVDPARLAARNAIVEPVTALSRGVTRAADRWAQGRPAVASDASCAAGALDAAARMDSTLGKTNMQGGFERKWMFCALALAHLKIVTAPEYDAAAQSRVRDWFARYLPQLRETYSRPPGKGPGPSMQLNNHATWAGLCAMALSLAVGDETNWRWGLSRIHLTLDQVDSDGFLPLEMKRGSKALHYHGFTVGPLVLAGFLARTNGIDIAGDASGPFHRVAKRTLLGYTDSSAFEARTGKKQIPFGAHYDMSWVEIYAGEYNDPAALSVLGDRRPRIQPWLGGNLTLWHARDR